MKINENNKKIITSSVYDKFYEPLLGLDILPEHTVTMYFRKPGRYYITEKLYPTDLGEYIDNNNIKTVEELRTFSKFDIPLKIDHLITKLHKEGIFHGDLHAKNILLDMETYDVRIIDFDPKHVDTIENVKQTSLSVEKYKKLWLSDSDVELVELNTFEDLINYEKNMWKIGYLTE